jgi:hypothetical protein
MRYFLSACAHSEPCEDDNLRQLNRVKTMTEKRIWINRKIWDITLRDIRTDLMKATGFKRTAIVNNLCVSELEFFLREKGENKLAVSLLLKIEGKGNECKSTIIKEEIEIRLHLLITKVSSIETPDSSKQSEAIRTLMKAQQIVSELSVDEKVSTQDEVTGLTMGELRTKVIASLKEIGVKSRRINMFAYNSGVSGIRVFFNTDEDYERTKTAFKDVFDFQETTRTSSSSKNRRRTTHAVIEVYGVI